MTVIRGAVCALNTAESIGEKAVELVGKIMAENGLAHSDVSYVLFTATSDLDAVYPAKAVREKLLPDCAFNCVQEMNVKGSLDHCLRVTVFTSFEVKKIKHCYLGDAKVLRPDLTSELE